MKTKNNWYALSGVASSGKTTIINLLEKRNYRVLHESATEFVKLQLGKGYTIEQIRHDEGRFQKLILDIKLFYESLLDPKEVTFIDRGIPDTIAFCRQYNSRLDSKSYKQIEKSSYKKVFIFERLPLINEDFRPEPDEVLEAMHKYNIEAYKSLNHNIVMVPVMSIHDRLKFILENL